MKYVTLDDCKQRLFQIAIEFDESEKTPHFETNQRGINALEGVLERVRGRWYRSRLAKAAYLFVAINKGHLFFNGNKRLSLVVTLFFLYRNGCDTHKPITRKAFANWFNDEFRNYKLVNKHFHTVYGWAFYNLNKAVASDDKEDFSELKTKVESFLHFSMKSRQD